MFRDFSDSAKAKLFAYIDEVTKAPGWGFGVDRICDMGLRIKHWLGFFNITQYVDNLDKYHKKVLDKNNTTKSQIEDIFLNVNNIDIKYAKGFSAEQTTTKKIVKFVNDLSETINPNGGNLDMKKMSSALQSDIEEILESQATMQRTVEDEMLGTDPKATTTSIDPVNLSTGNYIYEYNDIKIGGEIPLEFHRYYNSKDVKTFNIGKSFRHNYEIYLEINDDIVDLTLEDGRHIHFKKTGNEYIGINTSGEILNEENSIYQVQMLDGKLMIFNNDLKIARLEDRNGLGINYSYNDEKKLVKACSDNNSYLIYEYDNENGYIKKVLDHSGRKVLLSYDGNKLVSVKLHSGKSITYKYGANGRIEELVSGKTPFSVRNEYDSKFRTTKQDFPDGSSMSFIYDDGNNRVTQVERNGVKTVYVHDENYRNTEIIYEDGTTEKYIYNEKNQCIRYSDRKGNVQRMSYDNRGNLIQKIDAIKRRFNMTYDVNNNLLSITVNGKMIVKNRYDRNGNLTLNENRLGNRVTTINDEKGRTISTIYPDGSKRDVTYDNTGNVSSITTPYGGIIQYFYNELNQVTKVIDAKENESTFLYNSSGNAIKETNALGNSKYYTYNNENLLTDVIDYNGTKTSRTYNSINKLDKFIDQAGNETLLKYDFMWNISEMILPDGAVTKCLFDKNNQLTEIIDELGNSTVMEYNANGECISEAIGDSKIEFSYDEVGRLIKVKNADGGISEYVYDLKDNITHITDALGNEVQLEYDDAGRLVLEESSFGEIRRYTYNVLDKISTIEDELGNITEYKYILGGREVECIIYPDGLEEKFTYDINGNVASSIDRSGNVTTYEYDVLDRMISISLNGTVVKNISYDEVGNVTSVEDDNGNITRYYYSVKGELIKVIDPVGNVAEYTYSVNGHLISSTKKSPTGEISVINNYGRDLMGQITSITDATGNKESFKYDIKGQLIKKIDKDGYLTKYNYTKQGDVNRIEYADGREVIMSYNELRHLEEVEDWHGITKIQNDGIGRALSVKYPNGEKVSYTYNSAGKRTSLVYPNGKTVNYKYDKMMRLTSLQDGNDVTRYKYDDRGNISAKELPNGIKSSYIYNEFGLLSSIVNEDKDGFLDKYTYTYDAVGRKNSILKQRRNADTENGFYEFKYDLMGRLSEVTQDSTLLRKYEYDTFGNRSTLIEEDAITNYEYNKLNQLVRKTSNADEEIYSYDQRGNLINISTDGTNRHKYSYGALNRLEEATNQEGMRSQYIYNGLGHRIGVESKGNASYTETTNFIIDMTKQYNNLIQKEENGSLYDFTWDDKVVSINGNGKKNYYLHDEMGTPMRLTNELGAVRETYLFDEYGREVSPDINSINPFGFTGYQKDYVSGTYYAQAREYIPSNGRFASRDFVKGRQDDLISINEYIYCRDDPNNYVDYNGLFVLTTLAIVGVGALVGAGVSATINAGTQAIKIHQGKQESFQWGSLAGSAVEGAIVGGVSAIPGVGATATIIGGVAGGAAKSTISQAIDKKSVNVLEVVEDGVVGGITSGIFYGIGNQAKKIKLSGKKPQKDTKELYKTAGESVSKKLKQIEVAKNATGRASPLRYRQLAQFETEAKGLLKKYACEKVKGGVKKGVESSVNTVFGIKTTKTIFKEVTKRFLPIYDDEETALEYLEDYFGTMYGKLDGRCPLYA